MLRVKNGPCAPLRFNNMLSWPATGTTDISVTTGASSELIFDMTSSLSRKPRACGRVAADTRQDSKPATCSRIALLSRHEPAPEWIGPSGSSAEPQHLAFPPGP